MRTSEQAILDSVSDPDAFEPVIAEHGATIHRYLARRVGEDVAEDLTAQVFMAAFRSRSAFDPQRGAVRPWLYGIATNVIRRHAKHEARVLDAERRAARREDDTPDRDNEFGAALAAALAGMQTRHRDAFLLYILGELSYEEVAQAMDVPVGSVRSWIHRARVSATKELGRWGIVARNQNPEVSGA